MLSSNSASSGVETDARDTEGHSCHLRMQKPYEKFRRARARPSLLNTSPRSRDRATLSKSSDLRATHHFDVLLKVNPSKVTVLFHGTPVTTSQNRFEQSSISVGIENSARLRITRTEPSSTALSPSSPSKPTTIVSVRSGRSRSRVS